MLPGRVRSESMRVCASAEWATVALDSCNKRLSQAVSVSKTVARINILAVHKRAVCIATPEQREGRRKNHLHGRAVAAGVLHAPVVRQQSRIRHLVRQERSAVRREARVPCAWEGFASVKSSNHMCDARHAFL